MIEYNNQNKDINAIFEILDCDIPDPKSDLDYVNDFTFLVAVVLSAQATDVSVNKATKDLFVKYDSPEKILNLGIDKFKQYVKTIGLYNSKSQNIMKLCQILIEQHNSKVPQDFESLIKLPGVGQKSANVVLNCLFHKPTIGVDTHVFRISRRIGLTSAKTHKQIEKDLMRCIPQKWLTKASNLLVLHGRYTCKARKPLCTKCKITKYCDYYNASK